MALALAAASSQRIENASPFILAVPFTVGAWVSLASTGSTRYVWCLTDTAGSTNYWYVRISTGNLPVMGAFASTDTSTTASTTALIAGGWAFIVARFIATNNRKLAAIAHDGSFATGSSTTSKAVTGADKMAIGMLTHSSPTLPFDGRIAEWWITNADIQSDTGNTYQDLVRQLAWGGPFSVPRVAKDIIEYRSFRKGIVSDTDEAGEVYHGAGGRQTWTSVNTPTLGEHCPLPYWFRRPAPQRQSVII